VQSSISIGWLSSHPRKIDTAAALQVSDDATYGKQRERRFAFCVQWFGQRNRKRVSSGNHEGKKGVPMVSFWWVVAAFIAGGCAGALVMSLMQIAGGLPEQSAQAPDLSGLPW
jgi:hypothetical protein